MSTSVDTTTKVSNLLPTGTFLTFQVLAPLATNNGKCGLTEKILTAATLLILVLGCIITSFTDSYTAPNGRVYNGFLTRRGLWVLDYDADEERVGGAQEDGHALVPEDDQEPKPPQGKDHAVKINKHYYVAGSNFVIKPLDYINALLSAVAFLTLTMFTDPVSTCFYPNLSETVLKTLPVLLAAVLSFFCSFSGKVRHGYGNSYPGRQDPPGTPVKESRVGTVSRRSQPLKPVDETRILIKDDGHESTKSQ